jgi:hypothetical protein
VFYGPLTDQRRYECTAVTVEAYDPCVLRCSRSRAGASLTLVSRTSETTRLGCRTAAGQVRLATRVAAPLD